MVKNGNLGASGTNGGGQGGKQFMSTPLGKGDGGDHQNGKHALKWPRIRNF